MSGIMNYRRHYAFNFKISVKKKKLMRSTCDANNEIYGIYLSNECISFSQNKIQRVFFSNSYNNRNNTQENNIDNKTTK